MSVDIRSLRAHTTTSTVPPFAMLVRRLSDKGRVVSRTLLTHSAGRLSDLNLHPDPSLSEAGERRGAQRRSIQTRDDPRRKLFPEDGGQTSTSKGFLRRSVDVGPSTAFCPERDSPAEEGSGAGLPGRGRRSDSVTISECVSRVVGRTG